jgi:hypothetical protein
VNAELETIWKEVCGIILRYCPSIYLEGLRKVRETSERMRSEFLTAVSIMLFSRYWRRLVS